MLKKLIIAISALLIICVLIGVGAIIFLNHMFEIQPCSTKDCYNALLNSKYQQEYVKNASKYDTLFRFINNNKKEIIDFNKTKTHPDLYLNRPKSVLIQVKRDNKWNIPESLQQDFKVLNEELGKTTNSFGIDSNGIIEMWIDNYEIGDTGPVRKTHTLNWSAIPGGHFKTDSTTKFLVLNSHLKYIIRTNCGGF